MSQDLPCPSPHHRPLVWLHLHIHPSPTGLTLLQPHWFLAAPQMYQVLPCPRAFVLAVAFAWMVFYIFYMYYFLLPEVSSQKSANQWGLPWVRYPKLQHSSIPLSLLKLSNIWYMSTRHMVHYIQYSVIQYSSIYYIHLLCVSRHLIQYVFIFTVSQPQAQLHETSNLILLTTATLEPRKFPGMKYALAKLFVEWTNPNISWHHRRAEGIEDVRGKQEKSVTKTKDECTDKSHS